MQQDGKKIRKIGKIAGPVNLLVEFLSVFPVEIKDVIREKKTLNCLMKTPKLHFVQMSAEDLPKVLKSLVQRRKKSTIQFTDRAMTLTEKLALAPKSPGAEIPFDKEFERDCF